MRSLMRHALANLIACFTATVSLAQPARVESRVESVALFKNGLAVVERVVEVPGPGEFELADVPDPVHGTFWIESTAEVQTRVTQREVDVPISALGGNLQEELAGK